MNRMPEMQVTKRNGRKEPVSFDKVIKRVRLLCQGLKTIDPISVAQKVCGRIYDGVPTSELDELAAEICTTLVTTNLEYGVLASRIIISNHHKTTSPSFSEAMTTLYNNVDIHGSPNPLLAEDVYKIIMENKEKLNNVIDYKRDYNFDYFGFKTLEKAYLMKINGKIIERIQHLLMRVSIGIHKDDIPAAIESYHLMSQKYFTHATPTLYHAGTPRPQMASCFLGGTDDSIEGIYDTIKKCALISKWAGGIGIHISNIRSDGRKIRGTNGKSDGIIPMARVYNDTAKYVNQCWTNDTIIYTQEGIKLAKDIEIGDMLLTNDGSYKEVKKVFKREHDHNEEIVKYRIMSSLFPNRCTKQHQIFVIKEVGRINNHYKVMDMLDNGVVKPEYVSAGELTDKDYVCFKIPESEQRDLELGYDLYYYYVYGVCLMKSIVEEDEETGEYYVSLTIGEHLIGEFKKHFDKWDINYRIENRKTFVWLLNEDIFFNEYKVDKKIHILHNDFYHLGRDATLNILKGIFYKRNIELRVRDYDRKFVSAVRYLLLSLGYLGRGVLKNGIYHFVYPKELDGKKNNKYFRHNGWLYSKISNVKMVKYRGYVYDFNVEDNHNYTTDNGLVHNSGKRPGAFALYLEPHHPDVLDFLDLKKNHGDPDRRARDLFLAMWLSDLFMEKVKDDEEWYLLDPDECPGLQDAYGDDYKELYYKYVSEDKYVRKIKAKDIWNKILESQIETGIPYILYKDAVNLKSNQMNIGTIKSSNLCVHGDTNILTKDGYKKISDLDGLYVDVWNGNEFSSSLVSKTGINQELLLIKFNGGQELKCTPYHKFYIKHFNQNNNEFTTQIIEAKDLVKGMETIFYSLPEDSFKNKRFNKITNIEKLPDTYDTYCFNEPIRHMGILNGVLTGNCAEIVEYSDHENWAVCNLASISLSSFVINKTTYDYDKLVEVVGVAIRNLNKVIDNNFYPIPETSRTNFAHRPVGLGVQGLADTFCKMRAPFDSERARKINREIFEAMYYGAVKMSCELAKKEGPYSSFKGSPISEGKFQFDLWGIEPSDRWDWDSLRKDVMEHGVRNSLLIALMPTASTSQILGNNECIEPMTSNIYTRSTIAGTFIVINKYLIQDLEDLGLWDEEMKNTLILTNGDIQNIEGIPNELKELYKTSWEMRQKPIVDLAADRAPFVCQTQSMNLFFEDLAKNPSKLSSALFYGWKRGLKTGSYYIRSRPKVQAQQITLDPEKVKNAMNNIKAQQTVCSLANPESCDMCSG